MNEDFLERLSAVAKQADTALRELRAEMVEARKLSKEIDQKRKEVSQMISELTREEVRQVLEDWLPELRSELSNTQDFVLTKYTDTLHRELSRLERIWMNNTNNAGGMSYKGIFEEAARIEEQGKVGVFIPTEEPGLTLPPSAKKSYVRKPPRPDSG